MGIWQIHKQDYSSWRSHMPGEDGSVSTWSDIRLFSKNLLTSVSQYQTHSKLLISWLSKLGNINGLVLEVRCKIFASDLMVLFIKDLVNLPSIYLISLRPYLAFLVKNHQCQRNITIWVYIDWFPVAVLLSFILLVVNGLM